jgi:hypothetical protein
LREFWEACISNSAPSTGAPGWKAVPEGTFRGAILKALDASQWITDGNYHSVRDLVWDRADCVVWLNYRLPLILTRLVRRTATRIVSGQRCCNGNRETLRLLLSRESIILWALKTHGRRSREYPPLLRRFAEQGKSVVIHGSTKETRAWVDQIRRAHSEAQS